MTPYFILVLFAFIGRLSTTVLILVLLKRVYRPIRQVLPDRDRHSCKKEFRFKHLILFSVVTILSHVLWVVLYYMFDPMVANMSEEMFSNNAGIIALSRLLIGTPGVVGLVGCIIALAVIWRNVVGMRKAGDS